MRPLKSHSTSFLKGEEMCPEGMYLCSQGLSYTLAKVSFHRNCSDHIPNQHPKPLPPTIRAASLSPNGVVLNTQVHLSLHLKLSALGEVERALSQVFNRPQTNYVNFIVRKGRD